MTHEQLMTILRKRDDELIARIKDAWLHGTWPRLSEDPTPANEFGPVAAPAITAPSLRDRRVVMEEAIRKAVADFEAATGFCVATVLLGRSYDMEGPTFGTVSVRTEVTL